MSRRVSFRPRDASNIELEGFFFTPNHVRLNLICVLVHPWGFLGGSMANTYNYAKSLTENYGIRCLIFNLRGVGSSTGSASFKCNAEIADVLGACDWVRQNFNARVILVGSSAGAAIAGSALDMAQNAVGYVGIGYTFGWWSSIVLGSHFAAILGSKKPKLFIMGDHDGFTSVHQLGQRVKCMENATVRIVENVGHFGFESPAYADSTCNYIASFVSNLKNGLE